MPGVWVQKVGMVGFRIDRYALIPLATLLALTAIPALAQETAGASASVTIIEPLSVAKTQDLRFGAVSVGAQEGTVTISPAGILSVSGGASLVSGGAASAAQFTVSGEGDAAYSISVPTSFSLGPLLASTAGHVSSLPTAGATTFAVGATLTLPAQAPPGQYNGTLTVTAAYD